MQSGPASDSPPTNGWPLILTLHLEGSLLTAFATDGHGLFCHGALALGGAPALPASVAALLAGWPRHELPHPHPHPRLPRLHLQLPLALDALPWEACPLVAPGRAGAHLGERLGERFSVLRQVLNGQAAIGPAPGPATAPRPSRGLHLASPGLPASQAPGLVVHHTPLADVDAFIALAQNHEVIDLRACAAAQPAWLAGLPAGTPAALMLLALPQGAAAQWGNWALAAKAAGVAAWAPGAVALRGPGAGDDELLALCRLWAHGGSLGDAMSMSMTRNITAIATTPTNQATAAQRRRSQTGQALPRLYGDAWLPRAADDDTPDDTPLFEDGLRQVTAMSFDLVGSTRLMSQWGNERYSQVLAAFHACCRELIERHGGLMDDPQGDDGLMAYFGMPVASETAAAQAVRAGLRMVPAVAELGMQLRVGVATGQVAVAGGQPVGLPVHLAARLQSAAAPGTVLVAESTRALVADLADALVLVPEFHAVSFKGIAGPQSAYRAEPLADGPAPLALAEPPALAAFLGRETELSLLLEAFGRASAGAGQVLLVQGEAGIGKSRLLREFRAALHAGGHAALHCRCTPEGSATAYSALLVALREFIGLRETDAPASARAKVAALLGGPPWQLDDEAASLLLALLYPGLAGTKAPAAERARERTLALLLSMVSTAARAAVVCITIDDVHWADPSTAELLARLAAQAGALPLMIIASARSGLPLPWQPPAASAHLTLRGLGEDAALALVSQVCADTPGLAPDVLAWLAQRGDGVPLFLEESARMAARAAAEPGGLLRQQDIPARLQDLLMARLDSVGAARSVAQIGAVLGREFSTELLQAVVHDSGAALPPARVEQHLATLLEAGLLLRAGAQAEPGFRFRHALIRDTAYASLWERDRKGTHEQVAATLKAGFAAKLALQPELLAHHLAQAGLAWPALQAYEAAARGAAARSAHHEAIKLARRGLELATQLPQQPEHQRCELRLQLLLAARHIAVEGYGAAQVEAAYLRAGELCTALGDTAARVRVGLGLEGYYFMRADFQRALALADEAARAGSGDVLQAIQTDWARANVRWHQGDLPTALSLMDGCLQRYQSTMFKPGALQDPAVMCLCYSAWGLWERGELALALQRVAHALALASELKHPFSQGEAHGFAASLHLFMGEAAAGLRQADQAIAICEEGGFAVWAAHAHMMRGRCRVALGDLAGGLQEMAQAYANWLATGAVVTRPLYLALQAEGLMLAGDSAAALGLLAQAEATARQNNELYHLAEVLRLRGLAHLQQDGPATAQRAQARQAFMQAHALALRQGKRMFALRSALALLRCAKGKAQQAQDRLRLRARLAELPDEPLHAELQAAKRQVVEQT